MHFSFENIINDVYRLNENTSPEYLDKKLIKIAKESVRKQSRICLHKSDKDPIHIMYICHLKDCEVKIHKHLNHPEWLIFLKANTQIIYFDDTGKSFNTIFINTEKSQSPVFHFIPKNLFHTLKFHSDSFFIEVKQGPFNKKETDYLK